MRLRLRRGLTSLTGLLIVHSGSSTHTPFTCLPRAVLPCLPLCSATAAVTAAFLKHNNLELVIRSHEVKEDGYEIEHNNQLITGEWNSKTIRAVR